MLWHANTDNTQDFDGQSWARKSQQGSDRSHRSENHWMSGLGTWRHTGDAPHACTLRQV